MSFNLLIVDVYVRVRVSLMAILDMKLIKKGNRIVTIKLIQWSNSFKKDAT